MRISFALEFEWSESNTVQMAELWETLLPETVKAQLEPHCEIADAVWNLWTQQRVRDSWRLLKPKVDQTKSKKRWNIDFTKIVALTS
jgi:hypothetical protein